MRQTERQRSVCVLCLPLRYTGPVQRLKSTFHLVLPCWALAAWWRRIEIVEQPNINLEFLSLHNAPKWFGDYVPCTLATFLMTICFTFKPCPLNPGLPLRNPFPLFPPCSLYYVVEVSSILNFLTQASGPARFQKFCSLKKVP